jgi:hypothetical protein
MTIKSTVQDPNDGVRIIDFQLVSEPEEANTPLSHQLAALAQKVSETPENPETSKVQAASDGADVS